VTRNLLYFQQVLFGTRLQWPDIIHLSHHRICPLFIAKLEGSMVYIYEWVSNTVSFGTTLSRSTIDQLTIRVVAPYYRWASDHSTILRFSCQKFWMLSSSEYGAYANDEERFLAEQLENISLLNTINGRIVECG